MNQNLTVDLVVNGEAITIDVSPWKTLADLLHDELALTGTHAGCKEGECGSCTVLIDRKPVRSCLTLALQVQGQRVDTVEGYAHDEKSRTIQKAFVEHRAAQCGFCTSGFLAIVRDYLDDQTIPDHSDEVRIRRMLDAVACRCTGYQPIVAAVKSLSASWGRSQ